MLDTNIISDFVQNPQGAVFDKIVEIRSDNLCVGIITAAPLRYNCALKGSSRLLQQVEAILGGLDILPLDVPADGEYGGIRGSSRPRTDQSVPTTS